MTSGGVGGGGGYISEAAQIYIIYIYSYLFELLPGYPCPVVPVLAEFFQDAPNLEISK